MTEHELQNQYFEWLYDLVCNKKNTGGLSYRKLFAYLHNVDFNYLLPMDGNRECDGIDLRYRFGEVYHYHQAMVASLLDINPCSVLEMMCALALRCEESIMSNPEQNYGIELWFWIMIKNLGLESMDDINYEQNYVEDVIYRFLNREYDRNGNGGLFVIHNPQMDMRRTEIWNQMCWFLDEYLKM